MIKAENLSTIVTKIRSFSITHNMDNVTIAASDNGFNISSCTFTISFSEGSFKPRNSYSPYLHFLKYKWLSTSSDDCPFGGPIIYTDMNSQCYFVNRHPNNAWCNTVHSLIGTPCLTIMASNLPCKISKEVLYLDSSLRFLLTPYTSQRRVRPTT